MKTVLTEEEKKERRKQKLKEYDKKRQNSEKRKEYFKKYHQSEKYKEVQKDWKEKNTDYLKEYSKSEKRKEYIKGYLKSEKTKERKKEYNKVYIKNKRYTDPIFKLKHSIRTLISNSINNRGYNKNSKTKVILGCTFEEFKQHIESNFEPWMNWNNYGNWNGIPTEPNTAWDIDHIIPVSIAVTEDELLKLNHYTNLKPLCSYTNRFIKRDSINFFEN